MKIADGVFDYKVDQWSSRTSSCYVRVYELTDRMAVVVATEIAENHGPSITNSAEPLATEVVKEYDLEPERTCFVEHYDRRAGGSYGASVAELEEETYDFVEFSWRDRIAHSAKWRHGSRAEVEKLIGVKLP